MFNHSQINDNRIKQHTNMPYDAKEKKQVLEEKNTLVIPNKKGIRYRLNRFLKRKQSND